MGDARGHAKRRYCRASATIVAVLTLIVSASAFSQAPTPGVVRHPDAGRGETLARRWCAGCHVIGGATAGTDSAPTFHSLARGARDNPDHLRGFLARPHPPMAPLPLGGGEIEDLIAYLQGLSEQP